MEDAPRIVPGQEPIITTKLRRRRFEVYPLLKQEIKQLANGYASPALALFGAFFGAAIAFGITWYTVPMPDVHLEMKIVTGFWVALGLSVLSAAKAVKDWIDARRILNDIEKETVEVVIQEDKP